MRKTLIAAPVVLMAMLAQSAWAGAREENPTALGLEALGKSVLYGVFCDHSLKDTAWAVGAGLGRIVTVQGKVSALIPVYFNYYLSPNDASFFATGGIGILTTNLEGDSPVLGNTEFTSFPAMPALGVGYEIRQTTAFLFRLNTQILISARVAPVAGFSLGYVF